MARSTTEYYDDEATLLRKVDELVELIRGSEHTVLFTGAGISTAASIPDFRGPKGVWTMRDQGKRAECPITMEQAVPTLTHMAMVELLDSGVAAFLTSQNVDGLHRRSGVDPAKLAELHGNCFIEKCLSCGQDYVRDFDVANSTWDPVAGKFDHRTGRSCRCGGELADSIIHFGENLPSADLRAAFKHAKKADLHICVGSSLLVTPAADVPLDTKAAGGKLVIINLQETGLDDSADLIIHEKCDKVFTLLMAGLGLNIPTFNVSKSLAVGNTAEPIPGSNNVRWKLYVKDEADRPIDTFVSSVNFDLHPTFTPSAVTVNSPPFALERIGWGTFPVTVTVNFHNRDPLVVTHNLDFANGGAETVHKVDLGDELEVDLSDAACGPAG